LTAQKYEKRATPPKELSLFKKEKSQVAVIAASCDYLLL
jgi:hypothetical protein